MRNSLSEMFGKSRTETLCVMSWYTNWTPDQRQQLRRTIAQLETGPNEEDLLFGMNSLGLQHGGLLRYQYFVETDDNIYLM